MQVCPRRSGARTSNRIESTMPRIGRQTRAAALVCALGVLTGCDKLLEVDLPDAVTSEALEDEGTAPLQVNSVMALIECSYSVFAQQAAGMEDNYQKVSGVAGGYSQYPATPGGGQCDDDDSYEDSWVDGILQARAMGYSSYATISGWNVANKERLLGTLALYTAVTLDLAGEFFCEWSIDGGPLLTYSATLDTAEVWASRALTHAQNAGDPALDVSQGQVTPSMVQTAYGLRARIQWANGDLAGAALDAANVTTGHMAYILRDAGEKRRNMVSAYQGGGGGIQAAGFLQGPVKVKQPTDDYGVSLLGNNPATSTPWPDPVPFTGYLDLAIETATGRAVSDAGYPLTLADAGTEIDTRVPHTIGNTAGGLNNIPQKYPNLEDDIPLINWREMRLIQAEAAGPSAAGVDLVNIVRAGDPTDPTDDLPPIAGTYRTLVETNADRYEDMLIEERRRALWLEGRFWATKILNADKLWFPRLQGDWVNADATYGLGGAVRMLMQSDEYQINQNFDLADRATGCPPLQAPIVS